MKTKGKRLRGALIVKVSVFSDLCCTVWSVVKGSCDRHAMPVTLMYEFVALAP
jgi:hypothetical protein